MNFEAWPTSSADLYHEALLLFMVVDDDARGAVELRVALQARELHFHAPGQDLGRGRPGLSPSPPSPREP